MFTRTIKIASLITYINIVITVIVGILITPLLIKSLGQSEYGLYSLVSGLIMLMAAFDFGLSGTVTRFVAKYRVENETKKLQDAVNTVQFIFFILYILILLAGLFYIEINQNKKILSLSDLESAKALILMAILLPSIPVSMQTAIYNAVCEGSEKFTFPRTLQLVKYIIRTALIVLAIQKNYDAVALVTIDMILALFSLIIISFYVNKSLGIHPQLIVPEFNYLKMLAEYSFWLFIWSLAMQFFWRVGQISVAESINAAAVTIYALCIMLGTYYASFISAYCTMFLPTATKQVAKSASPNDLLEVCSKIGKVNAGILFFILGGFFSTGQVFITLWVGDKLDVKDIWLGSLLVMIGYTIPLTQSFFNQLLEAKGLVKYKAIICLLFLPVSTWIAKEYAGGYGIIGIISIMLVFWLGSQLVLNFLYFKIFKINIFKYFVKSYGFWLLPLMAASLLTYSLTKSNSINIIEFLIAVATYSACFIGTAFIINFISKRTINLKQAIQ